MIKIKMVSNCDYGRLSFCEGKEYLVATETYEAIKDCCNRLDYVDRSIKSIKSVLIAKSNGLGNVINVIPLLKKIKLINPDCAIDVMVLPAYVELMQAQPMVRTVYTPETFAQADKMQWDLAINGLPADFAFIGIPPDRVITGEREWLRTMHEVEANIKILEVTGEDISYVPNTTIKIPKMEKLPAGSTLRYIGINAGYTKNQDYWKIKHWGDKNFKNLFDLLKKEYPEHEIIIVGVKGEDEFLQGTTEGFINFAGRLSILETASVLSQCEFLVTNDSGNAHLASAVGCPTFTIFGPTSIIKNHPWSQSTVITKGLKCSPCQFSKGWPNCKTKECMEITAQEVIDTIKAKKKERELAIIVNSYKRYDMLVCFLNNLMAWEGLTDARLIVIDDGSHEKKINGLIDSFREPFKAKGNELVFIEHEFNYGKERFAQSMTEGVEAAHGCKYILFTSEDVIANHKILTKIRESYKYLSGDVECINFFVDTRKDYKDGTGIYANQGERDSFDLVKWNDGFLTLYRTEFLEHVKIYGSPSDMGSGIWFSVNKYIENAGLKQLRTKQSFAEHIGNIKSTMNNEWRKRNPIDAVNLNMWS